MELQSQNEMLMSAGQSRGDQKAAADIVQSQSRAKSLGPSEGGVVMILILMTARVMENTTTSNKLQLP